MGRIMKTSTVALRALSLHPPRKVRVVHAGIMLRPRASLDLFDDRFADTAAQTVHKICLNRTYQW